MTYHKICNNNIILQHFFKETTFIILFAFDTERTVPLSVIVH